MEQAINIKLFPHLADVWAEDERLISELVGYSATYKQGQTVAELIDFVTRQGDWIFDAENGALCQASGGECTA